MLPRELIQQQVLVKSQIPTPNQMSKIDKEVEIKRAMDEKNRVASDRKNLIKIEDIENHIRHLQYPCILLILIKRIHNLHPVDLPL